MWPHQNIRNIVKEESNIKDREALSPEGSPSKVLNDVNMHLIIN